MKKHYQAPSAAAVAFEIEGHLMGNNSFISVNGSGSGRFDAPKKSSPLSSDNWSETSGEEASYW